MISLSFSYADLEFFLLILVRISCFIFIAPFFGLNGVPSRVKIMLSVVLSFLLYGLLDRPEIVYETVWGYAIIVMKEAVTGFLIGYGAQLCSYVTVFAGHMVDVETGMSMAQTLDVTTRENVTITSALYQYLFLLMMLISGVYEYLIQALVDSFELIPVSGAVFRSDALLQTMITFMVDYLSIGFRIAMPIFCAIILLNSLLGVMAKSAPQMNMFSVGMQLKALVGFSVLFLTVSMLPMASSFLFTEMRRMIVMFVENMMGA